MSAPFDPAAWLDAFTAAGGSYALLPSGRLWLGVVGVPDSLASIVSEIVGQPDRRSAVTGLVTQRAVHALADDLETIGG